VDHPAAIVAIFVGSPTVVTLISWFAILFTGTHRGHVGFVLKSCGTLQLGVLPLDDRRLPKFGEGAMATSGSTPPRRRRRTSYHRLLRPPAEPPKRRVGSASCPTTSTMTSANSISARVRNQRRGADSSGASATIRRQSPTMPYLFVPPAGRRRPACRCATCRCQRAGRGLARSWPSDCRWLVLISAFAICVTYGFPKSLTPVDVR
jgi:hypothetical protein